MTNAPCGAPTEKGTPCRLFPLVGRPGGKCYRHAGSDVTEAQREAARRNPATHGMFVRGFLDEDERALFEQVRTGQLDHATQQKDLLAVLATRAARAYAWEGEDLELKPGAAKALNAYLRALEAIGPATQPGRTPLDTAEVHRAIQAALQDRELLLRQFSPRIQEVLRAELAKETAGTGTEGEAEHAGA